jgi:hypothetical protein
MTIDYERLADLLAGRLATHLTPVAQPAGGSETTVTAADTTPDVVDDDDVAGLLGEVDDAVIAGQAVRLRAELNEVF